MIGYRHELLRMEHEVADGRLRGRIVLVNKGFSAPVNPRPVYLRAGGAAHRIATDIRRWQPGETQTLAFDIPAPDAPCTLGLWMPDASPSLAADSRYAIRCANAIPFSDGVNVLGRVCG